MRKRRKSRGRRSRRRGFRRARRLGYTLSRGGIML